MIHPAFITAIPKLATWCIRGVNETVKLVKSTQNKTSSNKNSSGTISKLDRQLKDAELKYYQDKTKRDRDLLAIEKQKLANDNIRIEIEETRLEIDVDRLKLSKQERKDRLEISRLHRELLKEIQIEESKVKLQGKQIDWDNTRDHWFSKISREETQSILTKYNHRLLILTSPPEIDPYFDNAKDFQQWSFKLEMRKIDKFLSQYYSSQSAECPVQFYYDYFQETISKIDVNRLHDLLSSVATYVLYSDISDDTVTFWVVHWQTEQSEATHFSPFEWNWLETKDKLVEQGQTEAAAILVVKQTIIEIHRLLTAYLADSYYLTIDPFYEPQLFEIFKQQEQSELQPFVESLREFQAEQCTAYYQELAQREEEYSRQELVRQHELVRQQIVAGQQEVAQQQERARQERIRQVEELKGKLFIFTVPLVNDTGAIIKQTTHEARCLTIDLGNGVPLEMVYIPGGTFLLCGTHQVTIQPFHMGKYAITQAQYRSITANNPANFKGDNRPVEQVSWDDAQAFIRSLSIRTKRVFRLPRESEWEYACRAGTTTEYYFGETITPELVNYDGNHTYGKAAKGKHRQETTPVGTFPPNLFGLYDMHGNVCEWCHDHCDNTNVILRGGSWYNHPKDSRSASRYGNTPDLRYFHVGFRVACEIPIIL